jgi:hypothetical protein
MTTEDFDNYRFSVNTEVNIGNVWEKVTEVYFNERWVAIERGQIYKLGEIKGLREVSLVK